MIMVGLPAGVMVAVFVVPVRSAQPPGELLGELLHLRIVVPVMRLPAWPPLGRHRGRASRSARRA
jgi:hypothetical protein